MKKFIVLIAFVLSVFSVLYAVSPDDVSNRIGLTVNDVDKVDFTVLKSDSSATVGSKVDKIVLEKNEAFGGYISYFYFKVKVTSSHKIQLSLKTDGALTYEPDEGKTADTIDFSMMYNHTYWDDGVYTHEVPSSYMDLNTASVFNSSSYGQEVKYLHIGENGYLNLNDATLGWFYIFVAKDDVEGKEAKTYKTEIYVVASTIE